VSSTAAQYVTYCNEIAAGLEPEEWATESFTNFLASVESLQPNRPYLESLHAHFAAVLADYCSGSVLPEEVTAESVAGHQLLTGGLESWLAAIEMALTPEPELATIQEAVRQAELANRKLIALQIFECDLTAAHPEADPGQLALNLAGGWDLSADV
jgi:hypothetical protein